MRSNNKFERFVARLSDFISLANKGPLPGKNDPLCTASEESFNRLALELFSFQFDQNTAYGQICEARQITPERIDLWSQIPAVPTSAFKDLELSCLRPEERTAVFFSSGTTDDRPSRHFHNSQSLAIYEASLLNWFRSSLFTSQSAASAAAAAVVSPRRTIALTPRKIEAPHSSLVHMFETITRETPLVQSTFIGSVAEDGSWKLDLSAAHYWLGEAINAREPVRLLGTAFSFVHLLDYLVETDISFTLPPGSRVLETGGYKGRSRSLPKVELHSLITKRLGVPSTHICCEYGMAELSSQAYDSPRRLSRIPQHASRPLHFPPWARVQIISPETGLEVGAGESGLIRVFDLANAYSVMAIQTEDLGIRREKGFELIGRAQHAEPRGCSLLSFAHESS